MKHIFGIMLVVCLSAAIGMAQTAGASASATTGQSGAQAATATPSQSQPAMTSNSQSQTANASSSDQDVQKNIADALANDPMLSNVNFKQVQVNVTPDKVILNGHVPDKQLKAHMVQVAQSYAGNRQVVDHLSDKATYKAGMSASSMSATPGGDPVPDGGQQQDKKEKK